MNILFKGVKIVNIRIFYIVLNIILSTNAYQLTAMQLIFILYSNQNKKKYFRYIKINFNDSSTLTLIELLERIDMFEKYIYFETSVSLLNLGLLLKT